MRYYLRFGEIPENEESGIWQHGDFVGKEIGVSVYDAVIKRNNILIALPLPMTESTLDTFQGFVEYDNRPCYLVTGKMVGKGKDGEPLLKNVKIIKEIKYR